MSAKEYESRGTEEPPLHYRRATRLHASPKMATMPLLLLLLTAAVRAQSALDGFDPNANGEVRVVVVQPDGKILLGGDFTTLSPNGGMAVTRNHIARLNPDGALDTAFNPNVSDVGGGVYSIAVQPDGKILMGGNFSNVLGVPRNFIARLNTDATLDMAFNPNANSVVYAIAVQADGKILAVGHFTNIGGHSRHRIARLDATTGLADSLNPNANNQVLSIAVQADGKILVGGYFTSIGGQTRNHIARLDATTGAADSFDPNADGQVYAIAVQADGKILAGGDFSGENSIGGQSRRCLARLDAATGLADSFDPNASDRVHSIAMQADGKILAGGIFTSIGGQMRNRIARLDPTTGLADSFNPHVRAVFPVVDSIAVQADGKILAGGYFTSIGRQARNHIARLETDGRLDQTLDLSIGLDETAFVYATAEQPDGKILIGGRFTTVLGVTRSNIARLNVDGTLDPVFNPNANDYVASIVVQPDGKILAGGYFTSIGGQARNKIARLDATTGLADSFNPNASFGSNPYVDSIAVQADGKILAGGTFFLIGGLPRNHIARLDPTTGLAEWMFNPNANDTVRSIALQADGRILVGGDFMTIGGQARNHIARLDGATGLADSFNPSRGSVNSIVVQADGKILVGGFYGIARLNPDGAVDFAFNPNANFPVVSIAVQADGKILVGGIVRLDGTTGLADSFNPHATGVPYSIAVQADGKILAGGNFTSIGGQTRNLFARLSNDTAALRNLAVTQTTITWTVGGSSPQFTRVTFEYSSDNVNYTPLGNGTPAGGNWTLTGLSLSTGQNIYIRARGYYRSGYLNSSESITESVRNAFLTRPSVLGNISTRLRIGSGDNAMIGGFIITGIEPKTVIVRGIGPSLPVPGALADPVIEVHGSAGELLATNDNWRDGLYAKQVAATLPPTNDLESALWGIINPGAYTVVVRGKDDATGIGLFEVYDLDPTVDSKLANISTRGFVETGDGVMVGGAIITGSAPTRVLLRAIGPSLANFGVPNSLPDPTLELHDGDGALIASNDNWRTDQEAEIIATTIPPSNDLESAIVRNLAPGSYTAIVRGVNNTTGIAVVEAYGLN